MLPGVRLGIGGGSRDFFLGELEQLKRLHAVPPELRLLEIIGGGELASGGLNSQGRLSGQQQCRQGAPVGET
jgi:hypothetical protein